MKEEGVEVVEEVSEEVVEDMVEDLGPDVFMISACDSGSTEECLRTDSDRPIAAGRRAAVYREADSLIFLTLLPILRDPAAR